MANNIIKRVWNQGSMTPIEDLQGSAFTNENGGHTFQISGVDSNGESLALSGTVAASFLRPDQTTVGISGSVSGGVASVTLSEECYGIPGRFGLVVFLTSDGKKTAIYSCVGNVARSSTDAVAPGVTADVVDLINEIETAVGTIPASYSALMADIAPTYSSSALYAVGDYAWYEGDLKRCIVPIAVGETYTPAHWTSAVVGDDVCALKSAISDITEERISTNLYDKNACNPEDGKAYWNGTLSPAANYATTGKIPVEESTQYIFYAGGARVQYCEYFSGESGGTFIERESLRDAGFTTPENCTFVAIMLFADSHTTDQYNAAIAAGQLNKGSSVKPYEPYGTSYYIPLDTIEDGDKIALIDDTAGLGDTDKTFSADKLTAEFDDLSEIQPSRTTFFTTTIGKNKYNPEECHPQNNTWYDNSGAAISDITTRAISGKIPIVSGSVYTFSAGGCRISGYVLFNGTTFISKTNKYGATRVTFTAPANATHVGFNLFYGQGTHTSEEYEAAINHAMLEFGAIATEYEPYTLSYVMPTSYLSDSEAVNAAKATLEKRPGINLYNKALAVDGQYYDSNSGNPMAAEKYALSGRIPVSPNMQYCFSCDPSFSMSKYVYEYAQDGTYISRKDVGNQRALTFSTGSTTYYVGINIITSREHTSEDFSDLIDTLMLTYGACRPASYKPYEEIYSTPLNFKYRGVNWISCGTSITWYNSQPYQSGLHTDKLCRGYNGLISEETGIFLTNDGINGATLTDRNTSSFINRYNTIDWTAYDVATIEFAVNDNGVAAELGSPSAAANTTDFCGCLKTVIEYILTQNPTIILILCTDPDVRTLQPNTAGYNLKDYCDAIKTIADLYRLPVCDWYYRSGINPTTKGGTSLDYLTADGTHPNDKGHMRMAKLLLQTMESVM